MTTFAPHISVRSGSNFWYRSALIFWATSTLILKEERSDQTTSSPRGNPRCHFLGVGWLGQHLVRHAGAPGEPCCGSSRARWARSALRQWTRDGVGDIRVLCEPLRHPHSLLLSSAASFWRICILYVWRRRSLRRIVFSKVLFPPETLSPLPYRPLRAIQSGRLHLPEGLLWADRARSAAALFPAKQPVTSEFVNPSDIWCQVTLSVIPAEFSDKQLAGLIKRFAGNICFHAKRPIHVRTHHKCFSFTFIVFAMFQSMNKTSFEQIGARAMKNELKWWVSFFRTPCTYMSTFISLAKTAMFASYVPRNAFSAWYDPSYDVIGQMLGGSGFWNFQEGRKEDKRKAIEKW